MIPGFTSTGSKRPDLLFGDDARAPRRMTRAEGCRLWDEEGREYIDMMMALGAVSLGYAHPGVVEAVRRAAAEGAIGSLAPVLEGRVAERLVERVPGVDAVRFFKTGAEAVAAAIRVAWVHTGREAIVTCGYHGWLDGVSDAAGVPAAVGRLRTAVPFNDVDAMARAVSASSPAAVVVEPVVDGPPDRSWVDAVNELTRSAGLLLIADEIKTGFRLGWGGGVARYGLAADLRVFGKALGNGLPLAAVASPPPSS